MKRQDRLRNLRECLFALDNEVKSVCDSIQFRLKSFQKYNETYKRVLSEVEVELKNEMYGRSTVYNFETMRINLEQDAGNVVYEAINIMDNSDFLIKKQNVIYAFWFMGQFDVYALELSHQD
ncbi:hypothetical protein [Spiroplasma cantharicola]|uniref:Uncharacterized protein n=1 Tax=Spiroplasma cantharicola TaxID=362837 RepID=A0A0M3SJH1_9MOLU|nr:hypothetical protein [Spiroplasma cantharicola]ALD66724.1 hypothetical protein SCANT_v1c08180 [Spiroplasma cantharicola]